MRHSLVGVELDQHLPGLVDVEDFAAGAVLDPLDAGLVVLVDHRYPVARADAVVDAGDSGFDVAEFVRARRGGAGRGRSAG